MAEMQTGARAMTWWMWLLAMLLGALGCLMVIELIERGATDGKEQIRQLAVIEYCWQQQRRGSLDREAARLATGACVLLEEEFRRNWGRSP